jgi:outer membrane protein assembly factor BamB
MNASDIVLLGIKMRVAAVVKKSGEILWSTKLPGGMGQEFVTVLCDGKVVFACCNGKLHALDLFSGDFLWSNELKGFGYGLGSLAFPGGEAAPNLAAVRQLMANQAATAAPASSSAAT